MRRTAARLALISIAVAMVAIIAGLSITGQWPRHAGLEHFVANGLIAIPADGVARVEVGTRTGHTVFERVQDGWSRDGQQDKAESGELSKHVETALRFLNVTAPTRLLGPDQYRRSDLASFGLDPPELTVTLTGQRGDLGRLAFGSINPASTSQYVEVAGRPGVYLLSRYVGAEWQLAADRAARLAQGSHLLPVPIAQIWAVEIVAQGQLTRFERDNVGLWFHHVGQHTHLSTADAHIADPVRAPLIAAELAALDQTKAQKISPESLPSNSDQQLETHGLARAPLILLLYARDNSSAVARIEFGGTTEDEMRQYARDRLSPGIVTIDSKETEHLRKLLQLANESRS